MTGYLTEAEVRSELANRIAVGGGLVAWCGRAGLSHAPVSLMKNGHRPLTEEVANLCGFEAVTLYRRVSKGIA